MWKLLFDVKKENGMMFVNPIKKEWRYFFHNTLLESKKWFSELLSIFTVEFLFNRENLVKRQVNNTILLWRFNKTESSQWRSSIFNKYYISFSTSITRIRGTYWLNHSGLWWWIRVNRWLDYYSMTKVMMVRGVEQSTP